MVHTWNKARAQQRIKARLAELKDVEIVEWTRDLALENIPTNRAYRVDGVHVYADILNLDDMLHCTDLEGEACHKRTLRFLNLHFRAADRILDRCDVRRVDFANQRLHGVVTKPYDSEVERVHRAVAVAQLIIDVLDETGEEDQRIANALVRVGIDTGETLAVNNGRSGNREPLFLGRAANHAAKRAAGGDDAGIFLTNEAREAIGLKRVADVDGTPLTPDEVKTSQDRAKLCVSKDTIVKEWREDLTANPIGAFAFSRHTPPLKNLDFTVLTPGNSRRQEAISLFADLDGFTAYVAKHIDEKPEDVVRSMHVIRSELEAVLSVEFEGRRVRFIGDCVHGLMAEGTAHTTNDKETVSDAVLCSSGLRSSFGECLASLKDAGVDVAGLGLAVGLEFGPITATRLGLKGSRTRCSVSRAALVSEAEQERCTGRETAIGVEAYDRGSDGVRTLFADDRKAVGLDYAKAVRVLSLNGDATAKKAERAEAAVALPAVAATIGQERRPHCDG
jgi:hypothetical protein